MYALPQPFKKEKAAETFYGFRGSLEPSVAARASSASGFAGLLGSAALQVH
jgi:hypothetical protein